MYAIRVRNVNEALYVGRSLLATHGKEVSPRGVKTLEYPGIVITEYAHPWERVLFAKSRDANPFFHFFESLWMLAGRQDVAFPSSFVKRMVEYSDDGHTFNAAYGHRWRKQFGVDQIDLVIDRLTKDPETRRAVIAMYGPASDSVYEGKDLPCNTTVYFKQRDERLHMTVCCRSNDMLWGAYGANAVHFSFLQEYIASKLGVTMGSYTQISDSFHVYTEGAGGEVWNRVLNDNTLLGGDLYAGRPDIEAQPMGMDTHSWDDDLYDFFEKFDMGLSPAMMNYRTWFFRRVAAPMYQAYIYRSVDPLRSSEFAMSIEAPDWRLACLDWLNRHHFNKQEAK